ncbi:MAG: SUMF1/EgtB/PvdO family nonheme iron enzyme [Candidatus Saganbacteria bacterium]|nr:SUMF1/EgtB/PvdO family nonheme iron enzyme [Candidatus Saganbacteria bacterium]
MANTLMISGKVSGRMLATAMTRAHEAANGGLRKKQAAGVGIFKQYLDVNSARQKDWEKATNLSPEVVLARSALSMVDLAAGAKLLEKTTDLDQRKALLAQIISPHYTSSAKLFGKPIAAKAQAFELAKGLQPQLPEIEIEMLEVQNGGFKMGGTRCDDEKRDGRVTFPDFEISRYEITRAQFWIYMAQTGSKKPSYYQKHAYKGSKDLRESRQSHPVEGVTWHEANAFLNWIGYKLPTEARWEYAARGPENREYPWGNSWDSSILTSSIDRETVGTRPVNAHPEGQSWCGAEDMLGNVHEWVEDTYGSYSRIAETHDPVAPEDGSKRVLRGGSWSEWEQKYFYGACRYSVPPNGRDENIGFRASGDLRAGPTTPKK